MVVIAVKTLMNVSNANLVDIWTGITLCVKHNAMMKLKKLMILTCYALKNVLKPIVIHVLKLFHLGIKFVMNVLKDFSYLPITNVNLVVLIV
jgi:hypothetical protein